MTRKGGASKENGWMDGYSLKTLMLTSDTTCALGYSSWPRNMWRSLSSWYGGKKKKKAKMCENFRRKCKIFQFVICSHVWHMLCLSKASQERKKQQHSVTFLNLRGSQEWFKIWKSFKTFDHDHNAKKKKFCNRVVHHLKYSCLCTISWMEQAHVMC